MQSPVRESTKFDRLGPADPHKPGPGFYEQGADDLYESVKQLSRRHSLLADTKQFGTTERPKIFPQQAGVYSPGPGQYISPSQFGHYIAKQSLTEDQQLDCSKMVKTLN